jgi:hypothetical protein
MRPGTSKIVGLQELRGALGLGPEAENAIYTAVQDLDAMSILDIDSVQWFKPTDNTRRMRGGGSLADIWPAIFGTFLEPDDEAFLATLVEVAHQPGEDFADVEWVEHPEVFGHLGWTDDDHDADELAKVLESVGFAKLRLALSSPVRLYPTYAGVVRVTRRAVSEGQTLVASLLRDWETTTVEFKRELVLGTPKANAEFGRDITALANTKASGGTGYLIVGFDPVSHAFTTPLDPAVDQDRLDQILDAYTKPAPTIRLQRVADRSGRRDIGVIEVLRDPTRLPHRMSKGGGKIEPGQVFVRHGAHVVTPDPDELADLEAEGRDAGALRSSREAE